MEPEKDRKQDDEGANMGSKMGPKIVKQSAYM